MVRAQLTACCRLLGETLCCTYWAYIVFFAISPPLYSLTCPAVNSTMGRLSASMPAVLNSARSAQTVIVTVFKLQRRAGINSEGLLLRQRASSLAQICN